MCARIICACVSLNCRRKDQAIRKLVALVQGLSAQLTDLSEVANHDLSLIAAALAPA